MIPTNTLPAIPWSHTIGDFGSVWQWDTPAFQVVVNGDMRSFYWAISDKSANPDGAPRPFADGQASSFEQAERNIRETIGKSYPIQLGYYHYAGNLATTFMLGTGDTVDLGVYVGRKVSVRVASRDGDDETYRGIAKVEHYDFILVEGDEQIRITPSFIMSITPEGKANTPNLVSSFSMMNPRTVRGLLAPGCTGHLGGLPGTIDHNGAACPVHEM